VEPLLVHTGGAVGGERGGWGGTQPDARATHTAVIWGLLQPGRRACACFCKLKVASDMFLNHETHIA